MRFETTRYYMLKEVLHYLWHILRHNASVDTDGDRAKMQYTMLRENHVIVKGLSMRTPRRAFGKEKILNLIGRLEKYWRQYGREDSGFMKYPMSTIARYIAQEKSIGAEVPEVEEGLERLKKACGIAEEALTMEAGVRTVSREELTTGARGNFSELMKTRHSLRYFSRETPSRETIERALRTAQLTPSACNRQSWHTHIYSGTEVCRLLTWQGGARGFESEPTMAIVVTADSRAFLKYEPFQAYVDGGLYAMNLINALTSEGVGTIPLSCGFGYRKLRGLYEGFGIPENELPIVIIGAGMYEEEMKVAVSVRKNISDTTVWHEGGATR